MHRNKIIEVFPRASALVPHRERRLPLAREELSRGLPRDSPVRHQWAFAGQDLSGATGMSHTVRSTASHTSSGIVPLEQFSPVAGSTMPVASLRGSSVTGLTRRSRTNEGCPGLRAPDPGLRANPGSQGANQALPGVWRPESEAQVFAILHKISRRRDYGHARPPRSSRCSGLVDRAPEFVQAPSTLVGRETEAGGDGLVSSRPSKRLGAPRVPNIDRDSAFARRRSEFRSLRASHGRAA
jgi:hypothetical protein